ncbi:pyrroloquinoline quinone precursor peptide PqqA [Streptomyces prasinopilosus]|uniref:Coenzyme PQQ synthesis protein A n=1 Tax=Streptomyces prasinopilosus TaxID=67344 RepID=A0A1G6XYJ8_9ACTN|nr:pyrroloquinoline quinone precursor peptide PqqA [Streptomyces prasinopilosus]SDD83102.1 coenzyme PQQ precursor peptide PqqA [Streptomyces prasinopilosus]
MADHTERLEQTPPRPVEESGWQTPEFVIVETALEVTAYSLATR